ncbi:DoxX family protein [Longimicrobium terrae]|uniref:Putative membrane protein YphA (DoxX/SURF4 family) n=1 Tax=Longimicrobium terrae TaxID=1639882 RepID=A0A841H0Y0_9BACT|nr:DoxX family protein [Longimicrobium terrae]MBB4637333.1 putative membrane protein YphA (DoxX/SURF4 family) [Longimicrobium terrae]MBB6071731.1 putative membrane protein YphA (DoxX/SURF4 family) [Longimicrobium terrae]NNC28492.1 DoxX family protein [Longimicrobium terrae]
MAAGAPIVARSRAANVALWVVQLVLAFLFLGAGFAKLSGNPEMVAMFGVIGMGQWFRYATGALEIIGAVLLLIPALAAFGAVLLACVMVGAICTHLFVVGGSPAMPVALLMLALIVAYSRRDRLTRRGDR